MNQVLEDYHVEERVGTELRPSPKSSPRRFAVVLLGLVLAAIIGGGAASGGTSATDSNYRGGEVPYEIGYWGYFGS